MQAKQVAYEQVNAKCSPSITLNASIDIIDISPFAYCHWLAILAGDARQTSMFVQFAAIGTAKRGVDKAIGQFRRFTRHPGCLGGSHQRHHDGRPGERCPTRTMFWRVFKIYT